MNDSQSWAAEQVSSTADRRPPKISREEFIRNYCERSGVTWEWLSVAGNCDAVRCDCNDAACSGWVVVSRTTISFVEVVR
jgi:hypothetical protein